MLVNPNNIIHVSTNDFKAVSLFSNCGAGDIGYKKAGFSFEVMAEINPKRLNVCLLNHSNAVGIQGDLRETWTEVLTAYKSKTNGAPLSLLAACPPCQGMSSARGLRGSHEDADAGSKDDRNLLAVVIANVAKELKPNIIVVENVPEFFSKKVRHPDTNLPVTASNLLIDLLSENYKVYPIILDMCDFGIPQTRKRSFLTLIKYKLPGLRTLLQKNFSPYPNTNGSPITLQDALRSFNLPPLDASSLELSKSETYENKLHSVPVFTEDRYKMVNSIPPNSGKSAWTNNTCLNCKKINEDEDVFCVVCQALLPKPVVKSSTGEFRLIRGFKTSSYKRMHPNKPASTILTTSATMSSHNTIHPFENRVLSILECSYLQTIDADFKWGTALEKWGAIPVRKMIGEAVPPKFTLMHGEILMSVLNCSINNPLSASDKRCVLAIKTLKKSKVVS